MKTLAIVISAYNEAPAIGALLRSLPKKVTGIDIIIPIVIDDGSNDATTQIAQKSNAWVCTHPINLGVGFATQTGFTAANKHNADIIVTMDGDGQHSPSDLEKLIEPILTKKADIVFGNRFTQLRTMPFQRKIGNRILTLMTWLTTGMRISDSQCGYRAYSHNAVKKMHLIQPGFEICSEIVGETKRAHLSYAQVPVKTIYDIHHKKSQNPLNAINIIFRMIERLLWN